MGRVAPARWLAFVFPADVALPHYVPGQRIKAEEMSHRANGQLAALGNGLVRSLKRLSGSSTSTALSEFDAWVGLWQAVASTTPEFKLPLRLLDTGLAYLKSRDADGKGDRGTLLDLPAEEREIVCEALRIDVAEA